MPDEDGRIERMLARSSEARRERSEIDDWLAGRGSFFMVGLLVALVLALVLGLAHVRP